MRMDDETVPHDLVEGSVYSERLDSMTRGDYEYYRYSWLTIVIVVFYGTSIY